jgi:hypothetical protein
MNTHTLYEQRQSFFLSPSSTARGGLIFCILVGIVAFIGGMYAGDGPRTWGGFLFNLFFFFTIGLGGVAFSGMQDVIGATWGRPIMRLHESFASFLPVGAGLLAIFFICIQMKIGGADKVYKWIDNPAMLDHFWGKRDWLKPGFMMARDMFAAGLILVLAGWQLKNKLGRDMALVRGEKDKAAKLGADVKAKLRYWSAPILVCYAICFSLLAFDLIMSLSPTWFSTLWGGWSFAVMMQTLMASTLLFMFSMRRTHLGQVIKRQQFHDVGKLMHGFTIFWAYLTYAHVLTYWYGNMPEETSYYIHRIQAPWVYLIIGAPILAFVFPLFALIPKASKWTAGFTIPIASIILFAQWLVALVIVIPETTAAESWRFPWIEGGIFLGFLGLFLSCVFWFGKRYPMLSIGDPLLAESLSDHH